MAPLTAARRRQHIYLDAKGVAWIDDTNTKVVEVVRDHLNGFTPERIHEEHTHLSVAQVYDTVAYYYEHKDEIDEDLRRREAMVTEILAKYGTPVTLAGLRERARQKTGEIVEVM